MKTIMDTFTVKGHYRLHTPLPPRMIMGLPGKRGIKIWIDPSGLFITKFECSLSRVRFGHNGRLIENQTQLTEALNILHEELSKVAAVDPIEEWQPWRIDMAWNFNFPVQPLVRAHYCLIVPGIRNEATLHKGGEGLSWLGAKSRFKVMLYNKAKKMRVPGDILRGEVSLVGEQLAKYLRGRDWRNWDVLWSIYYEIMTSIPPIIKPIKAAGWQEALGHEPVEVRERVLSRLAYKDRQTFQTYKQRVEAAAANLPETFSWKNILSPDGPPEAVHVEPRSKRH